MASVGESPKEGQEGPGQEDIKQHPPACDNFPVGVRQASLLGWVF